jgi:DMSO/TMAO reductase YedYZ heme-binding membrane subunit
MWLVKADLLNPGGYLIIFLLLMLLRFKPLIALIQRR